LKESIEDYKSLTILPFVSEKMPINLRKLEDVLKEIDPKHKAPDYRLAFVQTNEHREREYYRDVPRTPITRKPKIPKNQFVYDIKLETDGEYNLFGGLVELKVPKVYLPVEKWTEIFRVIIKADAPVPCDCWNHTREEIAKRYGVDVMESYEDPNYSSGNPLTRGSRDHSIFNFEVNKLEDVKPGIETIKNAREELERKIESEKERLDKL
jgi:hypothetical protein